MSLGIEFYKNYIGIEKPLMITECENSIREFTDITIIDGDWCVNYCDLWNVKPHLKLPEDLTDEELIYIAIGDKNKTGLPIEIDRNDEFVAVVIGEDWKFMFIDSQEPSLTQEQLNRGYSLHWNPKAKEYIENGLAIRIEK